MARTRMAGGGGASAWALVIFGIGFGICLVLSIVFYVQLQGAHQAADDAHDELRQFVSRAQESSPAIVSRLDQVAQEGTVVQQLLDSEAALRDLLTTDAEADAETLRERIEAADIGTPLIAAMQDMQGELEDRSQRIAQLEENLQQARDRAAALDQELADVRSTYNASVTELEQRLDQTRSDFASYRQSVEQMEQDLTSNVQQVRQEREQRIAELERERTEWQREADRLRQSLADARRRDAGIAAPDLLQPDGQIAALVEDQNNVYINLGRNERIVPGMTFEVFSPNQPIAPDQYDEVRGKATIMVFDVGESSAQARIVRQQTGGRNQGVSEGDRIINLAYSPDTIYTFFVHGRFDMEGTGEPTAADRERIASIIRQWGGRVVDNLTYEVDFVVLGTEPPLPGEEPDSLDVAEVRAHAEAQRRYERHQEVVGEARSLNIPLLNQNRFLSLVGYFER